MRRLLILGLLLALAGPVSAACTYSIYNGPRCTAWQQVCNGALAFISPAHDVALHLHPAIPKRCANQAFNRWWCYVLQCYGNPPAACPAISSYCWQFIN